MFEVSSQNHYNIPEKGREREGGFETSPYNSTVDRKELPW